MAGGEVRSRRSPGDAVVLGGGPLSAYLVADLENHDWTVRSLGRKRQPRVSVSAIAGADLLVVVAWDGDITPYLTIPDDTRRASAVNAAERALNVAAKARVPHVIVVTSGLVYGTNDADSGSGFTEDSPLLAGPVAGLVGDMLAIEEVVAARAADGLVLTVLRPAALAGPGVDSMISRHFEAPRLLTIRGTDRIWQFAHLHDVAAAVRQVADTRHAGSYNVASAGTLSAAQALAASGLRRIDLPAERAFGTAERLFRTRVVVAPPSELGYVVRSWTLDCARLAATGWRPEKDAEDCMADVLASKRGSSVRTKDVAAAGAVGAVVAILATAAAWRRAKGR